jgi:hypothetical protein
MINSPFKVNYTAATIKKARKYSLTTEQLAFVDLVASGWDKRDAYLLTMNAASLSDEAIDRYAREILARPLSKERIAELKGRQVIADDDVPMSEADEDDMNKALSKENMLKDLYFARKKTKNGSKEWLEISKMIADITRMKNEEVKTEDTTVHFYLPLTCSRCPLKNKADRKG